MTSKTKKKQAWPLCLFSRQRGCREFRLKIKPVIERAREIREEIVQNLPHHKGLCRIAFEVVRSAEKSQKNAERMQSLLAFHRIPIYLTVVLAIWGAWAIYMNFIYVPTIRLACPFRDNAHLLQKIKGRFQIRLVPSNGSREGLTLLKQGNSDLCFVQGGVEIPPAYKSFILPQPEIALCLVKAGKTFPDDVRKICTSVKNQGSHSFAIQAMEVLGKKNCIFVHNWGDLTAEKNQDFGKILADIDAVVVVKSTAEPPNRRALRRLLAHGFNLVDLDLGSWGDEQSYLRRFFIRKGYLLPARHFPKEQVVSYRVSCYIVAHPKITASQIKTVVHGVFAPENLALIKDQEQIMGEMLQRADSFSQICLSISVALIGLFGIGALLYRGRFNELNTLISLINIHQGTKDLHDQSDPMLRREYRDYLANCSDLLGIIDVITGYYAQENSSLLYNGFCTIIHQRCSNLKINIHLKIQHANLKYHRILAYSEEQEGIPRHANSARIPSVPAQKTQMQTVDAAATSTKTE